MKPLCAIIFIQLFWVTLALAKSVCLSLDAGLDKMCARDTSIDQTCQNQSSQKDFVGWRQESCVLQTGQEVIPEIINLNNNAVVPADIYQRYSADKIATSLVFRYFQKVERSKMNKQDVLHPSYDVYKNFKTVIAFNSSRISQIIDSGFLNQHRTGHSAGNLDGNARNIAENNMLQIILEDSYKPGDSVPNNVRPKYSFMFLEKPVEKADPWNSRQNGGPYVNSQYGNVYAVLDTSLKQRSTITNNDSLGIFNPRWGYPGVFMTFYNLSATFSFSLTNNYNETQIWGPVPFSKVRYLLADCTGVDLSSVLIEKLSSKKLQTPVYSCSRDTSTGVFRLVPNKLLYGTPAPELVGVTK